MAKYKCNIYQGGLRVVLFYWGFMANNGMVGKIDQYGFLFIERGGKMERQDCPYTRHSPCGHSCVLFGNPDKIKDKTTFLSVCNGKVLVSDRFTDERGNYK